MELDRLSAFLTVARTGNITHAAEERFISLSALSTQIRLLEEELGVTLFTRWARGVRLTKEGEALLPYAESALAAVEEVRRQALRFHGHVTGTLVIGMNTHPSFLRIPSLSTAFSSLLPNVEFRFEPSQTTKTAESLRQKSFDIGFTYGFRPEPDLISVQISTAVIRIVAPLSLTGSAEPTWDMLHTLPWLWGDCECPFYMELMRKFPDHFPPKKQVTSVTDESTVRELIRAGHGVGVVREDIARELEARGEVSVWEPEWITVPVCITYLKARKDDPLVTAARNLIREIFSDSHTDSNIE